MAAEIAPDDKIAGLQRRQEELLDIGEEVAFVDRLIDDARGIDPVDHQPNVISSANSGESRRGATWPSRFFDLNSEATTDQTKCITAITTRRRNGIPVANQSE